MPPGLDPLEPLRLALDNNIIVATIYALAIIVAAFLYSVGRSR